MPSPFPGMDPYLEGDLWTTFHSQFAAEIARQLSPRLRPRYVAFTERRFIIDTEDEDVAVATRDRYPDFIVGPTGQPGSVELGTAAIAAPLILATLMPEEMPHYWVEIKDASSRTLVTAIEILSPANKRGRGRRDYLVKRGRLLRSSAHLLEIDLLRKGRRVPMREPLPPTAYCVLLSRAGKRPATEVWPIALDHPLPPVPVPLLNGDPDVTLDLQLAFTNVYDLCSYDLAIDYRQSPEVALPNPDLATSSTAGLQKALETFGRAQCQIGLERFTTGSHPSS